MTEHDPEATASTPKPTWCTRCISVQHIAAEPSIRRFDVNSDLVVAGVNIGRCALCAALVVMTGTVRYPRGHDSDLGDGIADNDVLRFESAAEADATYAAVREQITTDKTWHLSTTTAGGTR